MKIVYFHNILWSRYRLALFDSIAKRIPIDWSFLVCQFARNEISRSSFKDNETLPVNHDYRLLSNGNYDDLSFLKRMTLSCLVLFKVNVDVIVVTGYSLPESWFSLFFSKLFRKKIILTIDSSHLEFDPESKFNFLKRLFVRSVDAVLVYGYSSTKLVELLGRKEGVFGPFHCVEAGFYLPEFDVIKYRRLHLPSSNFRFLFVGRLAPEKNILGLILAFSSVFANRHDVSLQIVGGGELLDECQLLINRLLVNNVSLLGPISGKALTSIYMQTHCFVLPSLIEPWGLVVNEALCLGTPVVVSDKCGCVLDLVDNNQDAIKFDALNLADLKRALLTAYDRFKGLDVERVRRCIELGQSYSPATAADIFLRAVGSLKR
ncbi:glycosyltransferase family 4 protein [Coleofasciculus sp. LEGE 07081]|nr:glycosyltransferase family 4 protein [Coleofasciculus sp. LEGE 07081]MBE9129854.1 glycosyltransferase family 4 protein [Coleofasciculus sp. LEGE 07081]